MASNEAWVPAKRTHASIMRGAVSTDTKNSPTAAIGNTHRTNDPTSTPAEYCTKSFKTTAARMKPREKRTPLTVGLTVVSTAYSRQINPMSPNTTTSLSSSTTTGRWATFPRAL